MKKLEQFRKAELRKNFVDGKINIFRAGQTRWSDGMADPDYEDVDYFLTKEEADSHIDSITIAIGYSGFIEKYVTEYDSFNEAVEFGEYKDLEDIMAIDHNLVDNWEYEENKGKKLNEDGVIVFYRHHRYMNYAYTIESVDYVKDTALNFEADLLQDADSTTATYCSYFESIEELVEAWEWIGSTRVTPFDKINKGSSVVEEFLSDNKVEGYFEAEDKEVEDSSL